MRKFARPSGAAAHVALVLTSTLVLAAPVFAQQPPAIGAVKSVAGAAVIVRSGRETPAAVGQWLLERDALKTGADGRLGVTLKDGTRLSLGRNTEVQLSAFSYAPARGRLALALRVLRGVADYISGRIADLAPGSVKIETPTSVIGVRGTHVLLAVGRR